MGKPPEHGLEDFIAHPARYREAFDIATDLAEEPCRQEKHVLLSELLEGLGCTACLTCRARELVDPGIRKKWTARAIAVWNKNFIEPCEYDSKCPNRGKQVLALRHQPAIQMRVCVQHAPLRKEIGKRLRKIAGQL